MHLILHSLYSLQKKSMREPSSESTAHIQDPGGP